jgi:HSP20 family protein
MYRRRRNPFGYYHSMNPWRELEQVQREMDRVFSEFANRGGRQVSLGYPAINIWANQEGVVVTAELPGVKSEDIDISVVGDTLTLSGNREPVQLQENERFHRRERRYGKFTRTFELPFKVEADEVNAVFERGVLHISLPRAEEEKPRKIAVKGAA